jgi:hypothetical protein
MCPGDTLPLCSGWLGDVWRSAIVCNATRGSDAILDVVVLRLGWDRLTNQRLITRIVYSLSQFGEVRSNSAMLMLYCNNYTITATVQMHLPHPLHGWSLLLGQPR